MSRTPLPQTHQGRGASGGRLAALLVVAAVALVVVPLGSADTPINWQGIPTGPVEADSPQGLSTLTITASDTSNDLVGSPVCLPGPPYPIGTTTVTCGVLDIASGIVTTQFGVTVQDTTPPIVTVPASFSAAATSASGAAVTYTASATDIVDGSVTPVCGPIASGGTFPIGVTTVTCTAQDAAGNHSSASFDVTVTVPSPPVISGVPSSSSVEADTTGGAHPSYSSPTAVDAFGATVPVNCVPASGAFMPLGTNTVTCAATAFGQTSTVTFTIAVVDTTPPTLTVPLNKTVEATTSAGAVVTFAPGVSDIADPNPVVSCAPASGSTFALGMTTVNCTATDASGNHSSGSFSVTVQDTTPPAISVPQNITTPATGGSGAPVTYPATATDLVDGSVTPTCGPIASGGTFPIGVTTVTCTAQDAAGNHSSASFTVTVTATTPPAFANVPGTLTYEANGPTGAKPNYTPPTAADAFANQIPVSCAPAPGALVPLGSTTVTCTATDTHNNTSTVTFTIKVVDTTPPTLSVPQPISVGTTGAGVAASNAAIAAFLGGAAAQDIVDQSPTISTNAPSVFPLGKTTVTFTATDASGNTRTATSSVTVVQQAPNAPPPPQPPPVDRTPPGDVTGITAAIGAGDRIILSWVAPTAADFDHVVVVRGDPSGGANAPVYSGNATAFVDAAVVPGTEYRYVITAYDRVGNASAGVALLVKPTPAALTSPLAGAKVSRPPVLTWTAKRGTTYYNVQVYRGTKKVLSLWPATTHVQLPKKWKFNGRKYALTAGTYTWYVWPGVGSRSAKRYGGVLGQSTFVVG